MGAKEKSLEEIAKEIAERIADEFMKSILSKLTTEVINLREDVSDLKDSMNKAWKAIEQLAEAQRRTEERLDSLAAKVEELAEAQRRTEERLDSLAEAQRKTEETFDEFIKEFRTFASWAYNLFGVWSHLVGFGMEAIVRDIFRDIARRGGLKFGEIYLPPLKDLAPLKVKADGYQLDLVGYYNDEVWIIEVKARFLFTRTDIDKMLEGLEKWRRKNRDKKFVYVLFAFAGIKRNLDKYLEERIKTLKGKLRFLFYNFSWISY
mgnify:CR=1 FL=1